VTRLLQCWIFFLLVHFTPCNVGLYSLTRGKNELGEKKIQHCKERVTKKNFTGEKIKLAYITGGKDPFTLKKIYRRLMI
jgi:hypothetical protein